MKPNTNKIIDELKEKGILHCEVRYYTRNPVKYEKRKLIHIEDVLKAISKIDDEHKKEVEELKERQTVLLNNLIAKDNIELRKQLQKANKKVEELEMQLNILRGKSATKEMFKQLRQKHTEGK